MQTQDLEYKLILEAIYERYGYDFRDYAEASLRRRLKALMHSAGAASLSQLQHEVLHRPERFSRVLANLTVPTSEMFRDPSFYRALRATVVPQLRAHPALKIWHAGCSTGEEVYSLAILLKEVDLYDRSVIYATDINPHALKRARDGIYQTASVRAYTANYQAAGGSEAFSTYYVADYDSVKMDATLTDNVVFAVHDLATEDVFSQMHLILCRNVFIYFNRELQNKVSTLFARSLRHQGFLGLGSKESLQFLTSRAFYATVDQDERIYQKIARGAEEAS